MYRKPNGTGTDDVEEGVNAWKALAAPIEKATGWKLYAFDPDLCFQETSERPWQHQSISVQFATALVKALPNEED